MGIPRARWGAGCSINRVVRVDLTEKVFWFGGQQPVVIPKCHELETLCHHFAFYAIPSTGKEDKSTDVSSFSSNGLRELLTLSSYVLYYQHLNPVDSFDL